MSNVILNIFRLFSSASVNENVIEENLTEVKLSVKCDDLTIPTKDNFNQVSAEINSCDSINVSIVQNGSTWNFVQEDTSCNYEQFSQNCSTIQQSDEKEIIISLTKNNKNQIISIYYLESFLIYLNNLSLEGFLLKINEVFNIQKHITFEIQNESFIEFSTKTIKFIPKGNQNQSGGVQDNVRNGNLNKIKNLCHCNIISKYQFTPDDFYPTTKNNTALDTIFSRMSLLYSAIFLFDMFSTDKSNIEYKLNGYKTISQKIDFQDIDISSLEVYYQIYSWVYEGGNIVDKIGLARNILSLNFDKENLKLSETTFEAIKSGYKIYQKENIKQYIEIRNKISDQLIELQNKADKIVENFVSDYKKTFLAVVSFFITIVVIRALSKGEFTSGFSKEITLLIIGFLLISLIVMFFSRWELNKQIIRYEAFYNNLKSRYADLLDLSDISRILNNDVDFNYNKKFIEERRKNYTILWVISLIVLFVITITLYVINKLDCFLIIMNYYVV